MVLVDLLAVGRLVAGRAVEIERADLIGVAAEMAGDAVDRVLHHQHALRAAEAAERRVRLLVGAAGVTDGADVRDPVGVVDMGERARHHARRHVEAPAGIGCQHRIERQHAALVVEAHRVAIVEAVALAGGDDVDLARQAKLHRLAGLGSGQRRGRRDPRGVALLAAEAAAQAAHHRGHTIVLAAQHLGADMLDLGRMLGRGMNHKVAVLARQGEGDLAFEIEMLLAADAELGGEPVRRGLQRRIGIAAQDGRRRLDIGLLGERRLDIEDRLGRLDVELRALGAGARRIERMRHHHGQRLAGMFNLVLGEQRLLLAGTGDVVEAGNVARGEHGDHAGRRGRHRQVELPQAPAGDRTQHQRRMQRAGRLGDVVDIERLAGDVLQRTVMALRGVDLALHSASTSTAWPGAVTRSSRRRSRFFAACRR
jgi:hypothetical protein